MNYYSPSSNAFYSDELFSASQMPGDVTQVLDSHYQDILSGMVAGKMLVADQDGKPSLVDLAPVSSGVPVSITPRQGMIMLSRAGLLGTVNSAIDSIDGQAGEEARIDFDRANEWRRDWPLLNQLADGLGLTGEQIDQLFITAATL